MQEDYERISESMEEKAAGLATSVDSRKEKLDKVCRSRRGRLFGGESFRWREGAEGGWERARKNLVLFCDGPSFHRNLVLPSFADSGPHIRR